MEIMLGALPSLLPKLGDLLADEYNLQKEVKVGIRFLRSELESMKAALEDISKIPADQLPSGDKVWARNVRELSYDIEDSIDTFMVKVKGHQPTKKHGLKKFIDKTIGSLMQPKIRRRIAIDIRDIKSRVIELHDRRRRYEINHTIDKHVKIDPRALVRYDKVTELVGIEDSRDEVIKILIEDNEASKEENKIVSIVGFGGLGKTTLANVVYENLKAQFDCSAFVSVSQSPDMDRLLKDMFYQLAKYSTTGINVIDELRGFLQKKRYLVIIDDIWDFSYWKTIRCALPDNDRVKYRIITTTRNFMVAKEIGGPYKMKPLSLVNSRILMYGRIFGKEGKDKCPDEQLEEVSNRILKKCGGVPLAIITIASLLASKGRNKLEWFGVCNSIGAGLQKDNTVENMRKVLSLGYYDMPSHLRTCLLYLSMFPEDYEIRKDRLIWLWIAEGFIESKKQDKSLFEIGENYFNELINRSMIQPAKHEKWSGMIESCRVHDIILDLICSLSSEENFVTIENNMVDLSVSKKVRRLSLQNGKASQGNHEATLSKHNHVRSIIIFKSSTHYIPTVLENFRILRVLDLEGCDLSQGYSLEYLGNLVQLRYLGLRDTHIDHLPEEIGNLRFLQMLDVSTYVQTSLSLPPSIVRLTQLVRLIISKWTKVLDGIGSLITIEELSRLCIDYESEGKILEQLAHLTELKALDLQISNDTIGLHHSRLDGVGKSVVECLNKLQKIQSLVITILISECYLDGWVITAPQNIRRLEVQGYCSFATLPAWMKVNPSLLLSLSFLKITVKRFEQDDLEILGRLPALGYLLLRVDNEDLEIHRRFIVGARSFPCLVQCELWGFGRHVTFEQGAIMPSLLDLELEIKVQRPSEIDGSFNIGLVNLPSLQQVDIWLHFQSERLSVENVAEAWAEENAVRRAIAQHLIVAHPNHPKFRINGSCLEKRGPAVGRSSFLHDEETWRTSLESRFMFYSEREPEAGEGSKVSDAEVMHGIDFWQADIW